MHVYFISFRLLHNVELIHFLKLVGIVTVVCVIQWVSLQNLSNFRDVARAAIVKRVCEYQLSHHFPSHLTILLFEL